MIRLIRKDGIEILLNVDRIRSIESDGETVIHLDNGESLAVKNHPKDITEKIRAFRLGIKEDETQNKNQRKGSDSDSSS